MFSACSVPAEALRGLGVRSLMISLAALFISHSSIESGRTVDLPSLAELFLPWVCACACVCVCECIHVCIWVCIWVGGRVASDVFFSPFPLRQGLSRNLQLPKGSCQWALRTSCLLICRAEITSVRRCKQLLYNQTLLGLELISSCLHSNHIPTWVFLSPNSAFRLPCF